MENKKCKKCGEELKLGRFAVNQDVCWSCFKDTIFLVLEKLQGEERNFVLWMLTITAEIYGETL